MYSGLIVLGLVIVVGIVALTVFKVKSGRTANAEARVRADKIEEERVEEVARTQVRARREEIEDMKREEKARIAAVGK